MDHQYNRQLDRIEDYVVRLEGKIDKLATDINKINAHGCARREDDAARIAELDEKIGALDTWVKRGVVGLIGTLIASISALFKTLFLG